MNQHLVVDPTVERVITTYRPRNIDLYHWLQIQDFVQEAVRGTNPSDPDQTRRRMTHVAALTEWVAYTAYFPVERRTVFDLDIMAEFIDTGNDWTPKVRKMARGHLKSMAQQLNPDWPKDLPEETAYTSAWDPQPYTDTDIATIESWAAGQRTAVRRVKAQVLLALTLGAGLYSHEVVRLRVSDITADDDGVLLNVHGQKPRQVPVRADYEQVLVDLVANVPADNYAFAPGRTNRKPGVIGSFIKGSNMDARFPPNPRRLRATWIVDHLKAGVPASVLAPAAGLTSLRQFRNYLYAFPEYNTAEYRQWLREALAKEWLQKKSKR